MQIITLCDTIEQIESERVMDKETRSYIRNTAIRTVAVTLAVFVVLAAMYVLVFPKKASDITYEMGMKRTACDLMETQYRRTHDINDLSVLFDRIVELSDEKLLYVYGKEFIEHEYFEEYCEFKAKAPQTLADADMASYVEGYYAVGMLSEQGIDTALAYLESVTDEYTLLCPYSLFVYHVSECSKKMNISDAEKIVRSLEKYYMKALATSSENFDIDRVIADAYSVCDKYGLEEKAVWQSRYDG